MSCLIRKLHHSSMVVSDLEVSRKFYEDLFGFTPSPLRPELPYGGVWYEIGEQQIHLLAVPNPDADAERPQHGGVDRHVALEVFDWDALLHRLAELGISYSASKSGRKALFIRDPDDNALELIG